MRRVCDYVVSLYEPKYGQGARAFHQKLMDRAALWPQRLFAVGFWVAVACSIWLVYWALNKKPAVSWMDFPAIPVVLTLVMFFMRYGIQYSRAIGNLYRKWLGPGFLEKPLVMLALS
jgi:hypothetical protein